jgi:hypothetical protein
LDKAGVAIRTSARQAAATVRKAVPPALTMLSSSDEFRIVIRSPAAASRLLLLSAGLSAGCCITLLGVVRSIRPTPVETALLIARIFDR